MKLGHSPLAIFSHFPWQLAAVLVVVAGLPVLVGVAVWLASRAAGAAPGDASGRRVVAGRTAGIAVGAVAAFIALVVGQVLLAPGLVAVGFLLGVTAGELRRPQQPSGPVRAASLQRRTGRSYLPSWVPPSVVAAASVALITPAILAGLPRQHDALSGPLTVSAILLGVLAGSTLIAGGLLIRRIAALPHPATGPDSERGDPGRYHTARAVAGAVLGVQMLVLGALAVVTDDLLAVHGAGSRVLGWLGPVLAMAGLVTWSAMTGWQRRPARIPDAAASGSSF